MRSRLFRRYGVWPLLLLSWSFAAVCQPVPQGYGSTSPSYAAPNAPLPVEQIVQRLQEKNAERAAALDQYEGTRLYRMQYRGFPSDRDAEMVVSMAFHAPNSKQFSVVSQTGS